MTDVRAFNMPILRTQFARNQRVARTGGTKTNICIALVCFGHGEQLFGGYSICSLVALVSGGKVLAQFSSNPFGQVIVNIHN